MSKENISASSLSELGKKEADELQGLLRANFVLHAIIEKEVETTPFGQITFSMVVKKGKALIDTINITKNRRKKYT